MSLAIGLSPTAGPSSDDSANFSSSGSKSAESGLPFEALLGDRTDADEGQFDTSEHSGSAPVNLEADHAPSGVADETDDEKIAELGGLLLRAFIDLREQPQIADAPSIAETTESLKANPSLVSAIDHSSRPALWFETADPNVDRVAPFSPDQTAEGPAKAGPHGDSPSTSEPDRRHATLASGFKALADAAIRARLNDAFAPSDRAALPRTEAGDAPSNQAAPVAKTIASALSLATFGEAGPDVELPRPAPASTPALVIDSFRLAGAALSDADAGFNQQPTMTPSDRSALLAVRAIHLVQSVTSFETALGSAQGSTVEGRVATLPNESNVAASIVQTMRLQMRDGVGTAVVNLEPDYLGAVTIALRVEDGVVTATLHAQNPQVRAWAEANEPLLRQGLADQGLSLNRLLVSDERVLDEPSSSGRRRPSEQEPPPRRPRSAESTTFEVVV